MVDGSHDKIGFAIEIVGQKFDHMYHLAGCWWELSINLFIPCNY